MSTTVVSKPSGERVFIRFTLSQRIEHAIQIVSFSTLVLTGIVQKYNTHAASEWIIHLFAGIENVRSIHRFMGVILIVESAAHVGIIGWKLARGKQRTEMVPNLQDARDAMQMILYFIGVRKHRARFGRYDFRQKAEYWSLVWGTIVMIATGLMMWFPVETTSLLPGEMIPAAKAMHGGEGLLAFLAILIWHMYSAHLAPEVFPFDKTIFTGTISEERMIHEHPLEYEALLANPLAIAQAAPGSAAAVPESEPPQRSEPPRSEPQAKSEEPAS